MDPFDTQTVNDVTPFVEELALTLLSDPPENMYEFLGNYLKRRDKSLVTSPDILFDPLASSILARMSVAYGVKFTKEGASSLFGLGRNNGSPLGLRMETLSGLISDAVQYGRLVIEYANQDEPDRGDEVVAEGSASLRLEARIRRLIKTIKAISQTENDARDSRGQQDTLGVWVNSLPLVVEGSKEHGGSGGSHRWPEEGRSEHTLQAETTLKLRRRWDIPPTETLFNDFIPNYEKYINRQADVMTHILLGDILVFDAPCHAAFFLFGLIVFVWLGLKIWNAGFN